MSPATHRKGSSNMTCFLCSNWWHSFDFEKSQAALSIPKANGLLSRHLQTWLPKSMDPESRESRTEPATAGWEPAFGVNPTSKVHKAIRSRGISALWLILRPESFKPRCSMQWLYTEYCYTLFCTSESWKWTKWSFWFKTHLPGPEYSTSHDYDGRKAYISPSFWCNPDAFLIRYMWPDEIGTRRPLQMFWKNACPCSIHGASGRKEENTCTLFQWFKEVSCLLDNFETHPFLEKHIEL